MKFCYVLEKNALGGRWDLRTAKILKLNTTPLCWVSLSCTVNFTLTLSLSLFVPTSAFFHALLSLPSSSLPQFQLILMRSGRQLPNRRRNGRSLSTRIESLHPVINSYWLLVRWDIILEHLNFEKLTSLSQGTCSEEVLRLQCWPGPSKKGGELSVIWFSITIIKTILFMKYRYNRQTVGQLI